jgi:NADPH:quinone reductase-like Zn-dependent oxidoreductase
MAHWCEEDAMRAIVLKDYGGVDQLEWREVPDPKPGAGEVRVKLAATSVNPIDWKLRSGSARARMPLQLPAILGRDLAGEVIELGDGVNNVRVGDRVLALAMHTYAQQVVAKAEALVKLPARLELIDAAALPLVLTTGGQLIEEAVRPQAGQTVLVVGATGSVGRTALFVAKQHGARVLAGVRGKHRAQAAELGADQVVVLDDEAELGKLPPLDAIADTVGGEVVARLLPRLRDGGVVGSVVGEPAAAKGRPITVRALLAHPDAALLARLAESVARRELQIPIARRFPLETAAEAQALAERGVDGKVVLTA